MDEEKEPICPNCGNVMGTRVEKDNGWVEYSCGLCGCSYPANEEAMEGWIAQDPGSFWQHVHREVAFFLYWNEKDFDDFLDFKDSREVVRLFLRDEDYARDAVEGALEGLETGRIKRLNFKKIR
jgi:ribosomal protein S27AE